MVFDKTWDEIFKGKQWGRYPSEDLVRFMARTFPVDKDRSEIKVLDLGCGGGANTWYLSREGFSVTGIDGSEAAIQQAKNLLVSEKCEAQFQIGDFANLKFPDASFDVVVELNAVQHNLWPDILKVHSEIHRILKKDGRFFGVMLSKETSGWQTANKLEENTFRGFKEGLIRYDVLVHLFTEQELKSLFEKYGEVSVDKCLHTYNNVKDQLAHYIVSAKKGT